MVGFGLRNPWRFSFDRVTGDLWIGDVGQNAVEEVDFVAADQVGDVHNFGWDVFEGSAPFEDKPLTPAGTLVEPITEYTHDDGCSVTGGYVYRGAAVAARPGAATSTATTARARSGASRTGTASSTAAAIRSRCAA